MTWDGEGVNVAVFSDHATSIELCLFTAPDDSVESERVELAHRTGSVHHAYLPDLRPGALYGLRTQGPYEPAAGQRFNPHKLLVDPYARALTDSFRWHDAVYGWQIGDPEEDLSYDERNSAAFVPKGIVVDTAFTWGDDRPPRVPWSRTVIYEAHVAGLSLRHPDVPEPLRGTYLGLASEPLLDHLVNLGVTTVELLPVHHFISERNLVERGLRNYWGYNSLGFFAPHAAYASRDRGEQVTEFKTMVKKLHAAGLEVILDVVYNHTCEGSHLGPTLSLRGLDSLSYYRSVPESPRFMMDFTGCGNSLDTAHPRVLQLIMDSLRYWVSEMHVDGFRFDLAPTLGRGPGAGDPLGTLFEVILQDPILAPVKLIAEPWDIGPDGYQVGHFPEGWAEWNDHYRDEVRAFWRGDTGHVAGLANRLAGSSDLYGHSPHASINFITCHDGYTLRDLVSYEQKHNEANGEDNRDGHGDNKSRNWGVEGETSAEKVRDLRQRAQRDFLVTLLCSQGVPMLTAGDEIGRTQAGNNNAYCQDNETNWVDWDLSAEDRALLAFTRLLLRLRRDNPALRRRHFFEGLPVDRSGSKDVTWLHRDGREMTQEDWTDTGSHVLGALLHGKGSNELDERGRPAHGDTLLILLNGGERALRFELPAVGSDGGSWTEVINTTRPDPTDLRGGRRIRRDAIHLRPHSAVILANHDR